VRGRSSPEPALLERKLATETSEDTEGEADHGDTGRRKGEGEEGEWEWGVGRANGVCVYVRRSRDREGAYPPRRALPLALRARFCWVVVRLFSCPARTRGGGCCFPERCRRDPCLAQGGTAATERATADAADARRYATCSYPSDTECLLLSIGTSGAPTAWPSFSPGIGTSGAPTARPLFSPGIGTSGAPTARPSFSPGIGTSRSANGAAIV
jgi:hypothetical protein